MRYIYQGTNAREWEVLLQFHMYLLDDYNYFSGYLKLLVLLYVSGIYIVLSCDSLYDKRIVLCLVL